MAGAPLPRGIAPSTAFEVPHRAPRHPSRSPRGLRSNRRTASRPSVALGPRSGRSGVWPDPPSPDGRGGLGQSERRPPVPQSLQFQRRAEPTRPAGPLVRVRLSVMFRCHIHQMLCIGGSQFPFGWSFVSIAKVPMTWNPTDVWTAEVELPAGMRLEYKYVILEEQDWTKQEDEDAEGVMEWTYRTGTEPGRPPDVQTIRKQMAIVDWQPGPNRVVDVPTVEELSKLKPGEAVARTPAQPRPLVSSSSIRRRSSTLALFPPQRMWEFEQLGMEQSEPSQAVWEELSIDEDGRPLLKRNDVWPYYIHKADTSSDQYPD